MGLGPLGLPSRRGARRDGGTVGLGRRRAGGGCFGPRSVEVPRAGDEAAEGRGVVLEVLGEAMDDLPLALDPPVSPKEAGTEGHPVLALEERAAEDQVDVPGLVLEGREDPPGRGPRALAVDD